MLICEFTLCENHYHEWGAARIHHSIINAHSTHSPKHACVEGKRDSMRTHFFTMGQEALLEAVLAVGEVKWPGKFFCSMRTLVREKPYCIKVPSLNLLLLSTATATTTTTTAPATATATTTLAATAVTRCNF